MPQGQLDQLPDLRQLALAAPDVVVADLVQALVVVALSNRTTSDHITSHTCAVSENRKQTANK